MTRFLLVFFFTPLSIFGVLAQNNLQRSVYFDKNKSELKTQGETSLAEVMDFLNKNPTFQIFLKGFTDADGSDEHNRVLSEKRVLTVRQFLERKGVNTAKITTLALGKAQPIADNATEEGKKQNRRVDINVTFVPNTPSVIASPTRDKTENLFSLYRELATPIQIFKINTAKDTTIRGEKGTVLIIPKNAFAGVPNGAVVDFKLKEAYSFSDIIRDNLNTMSGDKILQTGGMIYTEANYKGEQLSLQQNLQVQFNSKESKLEGMQLFSGERNMQKNGDMNWRPLSNQASKNEVMTVYASPNVAFRPFLILNEQTNKPISIKELCDTIGCSPLFIKENKVNGFTVRPNMSDVCGAMAMFVEARPTMPKSLPLEKIHQLTFFEIYDMYNVKTFDEFRKQDGRKWDSLMTIRLKLITDAEEQEKRNQERAKMAAEQAKIYAEQAKIAQKKDDEFNKTFSIPRLGWYNCDAYRSVELALINIQDLNETKFSELQYKVISKKRKMAIASSMTNIGNLWSSYIPNNEFFTIIALKIEDGESFLAIEENTARNNLVVKLNFKQMSATEIKERLKFLDN